MQDLCVQPVSTRTGGAFGTCPPLRSVHVSVELYFLALSVCRIDQQPVMCMWDRIFQSSVTGSEVRSCTWSNEHLKSG